MAQTALMEEDVNARGFRDAVRPVLSDVLRVDILDHESLPSAGLRAPSTSLLELTPEETIAVVDTAASILHETWRETRYELASGTFSPRIKATKDADWIASHGTDQVDIANTSYEDLPKDWQAENRASAAVALKYLIQVLNDAPIPGRGIDLKYLLAQVNSDAGNKIHEAWVDRNPWASPELKKPFAELPLNEQRKDLFVLNAAISAYQKALPVVEGVSQFAVVRIINTAEVVGHQEGTQPATVSGAVLRFSSGIALETISEEHLEARKATSLEEATRRRTPCPVPSALDIQELVRAGAVPTTQSFGDRVQGILLLTATQAAAAGKESALRAQGGSSTRPGEALDLEEVRYHAFSNGREGVVAYGFDLSDVQLAAAKEVHKPAGPQKPSLVESLRHATSTAWMQIQGLLGLD